ncbi:MAG: glycine/betaine ABC transporter, partial [Candidatus Paceibacteria bacterium]
MAGVNQTIMLALAMVVVAAMVGAEGLGNIVYAAITQLKVGEGIASGVGLVLLAMILDRVTKAAWRRFQP